MSTRFMLSALLSAWLLAATGACAQVVGVTLRLDTNVIAVGQSTTLRVFAQVLPAYQTYAERIFSWYVDVVNTNGAAASANYAAMLKTASDNNPQTSSNGFNSAANRLSIYDSFLNLPGAGTNPPVELLRFSVTGVVAGQTQFQVRAGSGTPALGNDDFIVAPKTGTGFLTGGDYTAAFTNLTVLQPPVGSIDCFSFTYTNLPGGFHKVTLNYCPAIGYNNYVEYRDSVVGGPGWQAFPGGPHNSGLYADTNGVPLRVYRIHAVLPPPP